MSKKRSISPGEILARVIGANGTQVNICPGASPALVGIDPFKPVRIGFQIGDKTLCPDGLSMDEGFAIGAQNLKSLRERLKQNNAEYRFLQEAIRQAVG